MGTYLQVYVNYKQDNEAKLLLMAKFTSNNAKNIDTAYISFEINYGFYPRGF